MSPLERIKQAGFDVWLEPVAGLEDRLSISPSDKLTAKQVQYLKANKQTIIDELLMTTVYTPSGNSFIVKARDAAHQAFLLKMNPKQQNIVANAEPSTAPTLEHDFKEVAQHIDKIRTAGFTFELIERGLFYIRPHEQLTEVQRQFLTDHAEQITDFLYSEQNAAGTQQ